MLFFYTRFPKFIAPAYYFRKGIAFFALSESPRFRYTPVEHAGTDVSKVDQCGAGLAL